MKSPLNIQLFFRNWHKVVAVVLCIYALAVVIVFSKGRYDF